MKTLTTIAEIRNAILSADFNFQRECSRNDNSENFTGLEVESDDFLFVFDAEVNYYYFEDGDGYNEPKTHEFDVLSIEVSNLRIFTENDEITDDVAQFETTIENRMSIDLIRQ